MTDTCDESRAAAPAAGAPLPVTAALHGFTPEQATALTERFTFGEMIKGEDVSLFVYLNFGAAYPVVNVARRGAVVALAQGRDGGIGETRMNLETGELSLNEYLVGPRSRAQGMIVVHRGAIVFEAYPGMRDLDDHVWNSVSKTTVSLLLRLLADEGQVNVQAPIESYVSRLRGTDWAGTRLQDLLDMCSGMDVVENQDTRRQPSSTFARFSAAAQGAPNADGAVERQLDVIASAHRARPAGEAFEYSSCNTILLVLATEAITGRRWHELLRERVWGRMTVEGDMQVATSPDGIAQAYGYLNTRLRDLARYGMLYTGSWPSAAHERIVPDGYPGQIAAAGRPEIYVEGEFGRRQVTEAFPLDPPRANAWQWDAIWPDGDLYKSGLHGQGLYISPTQDLVIAFFSTSPANDLPQYTRQIATDVRAAAGR